MVPNPYVNHGFDHLKSGTKEFIRTIIAPNRFFPRGWFNDVKIWDKETVDFYTHRKGYSHKEYGDLMYNVNNKLLGFDKVAVIHYKNGKPQQVWKGQAYEEYADYFQIRNVLQSDLLFLASLPME